MTPEDYDTGSAPGLDVVMCERADADGLSSDHPLRILADEFEAARAGFFASKQTVSVKQFMGAWARARRTWCDYSGEPLI